MNAPRETASAPNVTEYVNRLQLEAAKHAATIGEFQAEFHRRTEPLFRLEQGGDGGALAEGMPTALAALLEEIRRRRKLVTSVAGGQFSNVGIEEMPDNQLGENVRGGGAQRAKLNDTMLGTIKNEGDAKQFDHAAAHEVLGHGEEVTHFTGQLLDGDAPIDVDLLSEGRAEIIGNEHIGDAIQHHRDGQPVELYGEGQDLVLDIIRHGGREQLEQVMTVTGDLHSLQPYLDGKSSVSSAPPRPGSGSDGESGGK